MGGIFGVIFGVLAAILVALFAFFGIAVDSGPTAIAEPVTVDSISVTSALVDAAWLSDNLDDPNLVIVAFVPESEFTGGHIPGAVQIDRDELAIVDTDTAAVDAWEGHVEDVLTENGIMNGSTVVVYDDGSHEAARLWWVLRQLSHQSVSVLDGGLSAWEANGGEVETGGVLQRPAPIPYFGIPDSSALETKEGVLVAIEDPSVVLVDARTADEYAAGHIPGAINIPMAENYTAGEGGTVLPIDQLLALYFDAGITPDKQVIVYCSSGVRASSAYLALDGVLEYPNVTLYAGSWDEWSADPSLPVER